MGKRQCKETKIGRRREIPQDLAAKVTARGKSSGDDNERIGLSVGRQTDEVADVKREC